MGSSEAPLRSLHVAFIPLMAPGHMLPMLQMAALFVSRGAAATVITTPLNAPLVLAATSGSVGVRVVPTVPGLHPSENLFGVETMSEKFAFVLSLRDLRPAIEEALLELRPDAVVSDMFFPWTAAFARDVLRVPRFAFHGSSLTAHCACRSSVLLLRERTAGAAAEEGAGDTVVLPGLPYRIELLKAQLLDPTKIPPELAHLVFHEVPESESMSHGAIVNSFDELESDYANCYTELVGNRSWCIGPFSLCNPDKDDQSRRGDPTSPNTQSRTLKWLDSRSPGSVLYICFGSMTKLGSAQLREIALSLESVDRPFIWVVPKGGDSSAWLTAGLEKIVLEGRGMIIRGWAPQVMILGHVAIGGFVTHCGWNSVLEGISSGVPLVTWPLFGDQFFNEMVVEVLGVTVKVGSRSYEMNDEEKVTVRVEAIAKAVEKVMDGGDEARKIRTRAKELGEKAKKAVEKGGSSYKNIACLIEELNGLRS